MPFVYHMVPNDMRGHVLFPLNDLKKRFPDLYAEEAKKYEGRARIMDQRVFPLNCLWNDVLHLTAVEPAELVRALVTSGRKAEEPLSFFKIHIARLDPSLLTVFLFTQTERGSTPGPDEFTPYDPNYHTEYATIPEITKDYFRQMYVEGKKPLRFKNVPHILYKGPIDVTGTEILSA